MGLSGCPKPRGCLGTSAHELGHVACIQRKTYVSQWMHMCYLLHVALWLTLALPLAFLEAPGCKWVLEKHVEETRCTKQTSHACVSKTQLQNY